MKPTAFPWPSLIAAFVAAAALLWEGVTFWLVIGVFMLWAGSLWLTRPAPVFEPRRSEDGSLSREAMTDLLEAFGLPILMLDGERITTANAAAREELGRHIVGQDARIALRHPEAIKLLDLPQGGRALIKGLTAPRSIWQLSRVPIDERFSLVEMINRTAEADISRAHTDFVANASHELRTPLASIIGYIETLADADEQGDDAIDAATRARFHATVLRESRRLQNLVEDLMSLSRIEAEKHDVPVERIDFAKMAATVAADIEATRQDDRLQAEITADAAVVAGDRQQLDQLLRNLIDNALKYGDQDKPVTVSVTSGGGQVTLAVTDRGEGIAPEHIPHLTRRFYRTDPGRSRAVGGTGLGLAIVKHIVERHRGRLDISSRKGVGTTVTVRLQQAEKTVG
jgi:two-component system phosphate regulon sensor histidine kinase PhoR